MHPTPSDGSSSSIRGPFRDREGDKIALVDAGVMMLDVVAQLSCYYAHKADLLGTRVVGFGGVDDCRFLGVVRPGSNLILMCELLKVRRGRLTVTAFQGVVDNEIEVHGTLRGVAIPADAIRSKPC